MWTGVLLLTSNLAPSCRSSQCLSGSNCHKIRCVVNSVRSLCIKLKTEGKESMLSWLQPTLTHPCESMHIGNRFSPRVRRELRGEKRMPRKIAGVARKAKACNVLVATSLIQTESTLHIAQLLFLFNILIISMHHWCDTSEDTSSSVLPSHRYHQATNSQICKLAASKITFDA